ncbi:MAG: hypothetical protein ABSE36_04085 [Terracidiphilus sp.]|jgi:hypothetical protein
MEFWAAIALLALAMPALAQHGGAHAGSFGGRGFSGASGFSSHSAFSHPAFSQSPGFARPAPPVRYGAFPGVRFRAFGPQNYSGPRNYSSLRSPYNRNRFAAGRLSYDPRAAALSRGFDRDRGRNPDRDRFDRRRRDFQNWVVNTYPYWPGYPYLYDPNSYDLGFDDWDDSEAAASDTSQSGSYEPDQAPGNYASDQNGPALLYPPYPNQGYAAPVGEAGTAAPAISGMPLTVIFKNGRAPITVRNYLMTSRVLTDLDCQHYEQIPLDQIDLAATKRFNTFAGVDFQVPGA